MLKSQRMVTGCLLIAVVAATLACFPGSKPPKKKDPQADPHHHYKWANEQYRRGYYLEALEAVDKAIALDDTNYYYFNLRGLIHRDAGELDKAAADFQHVLEMNPYYTDAHNNLGATYADMKKVDEALAEFDKVLQDPKYLHKEKAHFNVGNLYFDTGRYQEAVGAYQQAVILSPNYLRAHFRLGKSFQALGREEDARRSFSEVLRIAPHSNEAREVEMLLESGGTPS